MLHLLMQIYQNIFAYPRLGREVYELQWQCPVEANRGTGKLYLHDYTQPEGEIIK